MIRVKIIGAGGYGGLGLIELALRHPEIKLTGLISRDGAGQPVSKLWQYLEGYCDMPILEAGSKEANDVEADVVFCSTPDGVGMTIAADEIKKGRRFIDYSGDFRFNSTESYAAYAARIGKDPVHKSPELLPLSVYGLTEFHREEIKNAQIVGNPGCFAVSCIVGLAPAAKEKLVETDAVICDCKSGVSGAGKKASTQFHYPERYDSMNAYRLNGHQHVIEIENEISKLNGKEVKVTFTPQVLPMTRGILSAIYGRMPSGITHKKVLEAYKQQYANERFFFVKDAKDSVSTSDVRGSNRVIVTVACDDRTGVFRVISHIDNLVKGQAGSALQNMNVMFDLPEDMGLTQPGSHP